MVLDANNKQHGSSRRQVDLYISSDSIKIMHDVKTGIVRQASLGLGGTRSVRGFSYQDHWSIEKLFALHESGEDYLMLFEVLDDVLVLDSEVDPKRISIFQVKTKASGALHTRASLCKQTKTKPGSILGKLILVKESLPEELKGAVSTLTLVSNSGFDFKLGEDLEIKIVSIAQLPEEDKRYICASLGKETKLTIDDHLCEITFLMKSDLSFGSAESHLKGIITEYFDKHMNGVSVKVTPFYEMLVAEVQRKSRGKKETNKWEDIVEKKGISRGWFENQLSVLHADMGSQFEIVRSVLVNSWHPAELVKLQKGWRNLEVNVLGNIEFLNGEKIVAVDKGLVLLPDEDFTTQLKKVFDSLKGRDIFKDEDDYYLKALIAWRIINTEATTGS